MPSYEDFERLTAERDERLTLAESSNLAKQIDNLREQLDRANTGRQHLQEQLDQATATLTELAPSLGSSRRAQDGPGFGWDPASPQWAVIRAAIAVRKAWAVDLVAETRRAENALIAAVDELPHVGELETPEEQTVSSVIAVSNRFARAAAGQDDGRDWVRLRTGSGRQYEGYRSPTCPGDQVAGHRHDIRCVTAPAPKLATGGMLAQPGPPAGALMRYPTPPTCAPERPIDLRLGLPVGTTRWPMGTITKPAAEPQPAKRGAFDIAREALLSRYGTLDPERLRMLGADSTEIGAARNITERLR